MKLDRDWHRRRRGIAGIVATVFMFAMLFTVGASYFLFVNQNNMLYSQAASARASVSSAQQNEDLVVTVSKNASNYLGFTAQNLGGTTSTVTAFMVTNSNGTILEFCQSSSAHPCPSLPFSVNQGATSTLVPTNVTYSATATYTVKAITQLGNDFSTTYPPTATTLAAQALSSGAIGDLYLSFGSYTWYQLTTASCSSTSKYCLQSGALAFSIPHTYTASSTNVAFSVTVTDLNPSQLNITLDPYTQIAQFFPPTSSKGGGTAGETSWYIVNIADGNEINETYSPIVLPYDQPVTLYFASAAPITGTQGFTPQSVSGSGSGVPAGSTAIVFIVSHGCKGKALSSCNTSNYNYGQNSPYVTTLYY